MITLTLQSLAIDTLRPSDARLVLRMVIGLEPVNMKYDVDADKKITTSDARIILRRSAGLLDNVETTTKENVMVYSGVLVVTNLTPDELRAGLLYNLKDYAEYFIEAEKTFGINAVFLASVAALESGWGRSYIAVNKNNLFGWKGGSSYKYFDSVYSGIIHVAKYLKINYLTPGGSCYRGYTVEAISKCYCPTGNWANSIKDIMRSMESKIANYKQAT